MASKTSTYEPTRILGVKGLSCPMPVVKTHSVVGELGSSEVLQVIATDFGSMNNLKDWADATDGVAMLDQEEAEGDGDAVFRHFIQKE